MKTDITPEQAANTATLFERTGVHDFDPLEANISASERTRIEDTLALIPADVESVLEVGCGPGDLLNRLKVKTVFGTDLGVVGLKHCTRPVFRASALALPFPDDSVDLVLCAEVLEHLSEAARAVAVVEMCRVARRHVLVTVPHQEQLLFSSHRCPACDEVFHLHGHQASLSASDLRPLFPEDAALTVKLSWKARRFSKRLLWVRTRVFGLWKYSAHTLCPKCGNQQLTNHERRLGYRFIAGLNDLRHPRKTRYNWIMIRADLRTGETK